MARLGYVNLDYSVFRRINFNPLLLYFFLTYLVAEARLLGIVKIIPFLKGCYLAARVKMHLSRSELVSVEYGPGIWALGLFIWSRDRKRLTNYVCFPHNIESEVCSQQFTWLRNSAHFKTIENEILIRARQVVTISDFDRTLITGLRPSAFVFHYFPPSGIFEKLAETVVRRRDSEKTQWLYVGSYSNPPSKRSLEKTVGTFSKVTEGEKLTVLGYGTQFARSKFAGLTRVQFLGEVDDAVLYDHISRAIGLFIHVERTSGFLTRAIEFAVMGVPIRWYGTYEQSRELECGRVPLSLQQYEVAIDKLKSEESKWIKG